MLILTALAVAVTSTAKRETRAAGTQLHDAQAYLIEKGAINFAAAELEQATNGGSAPPQLNPPPNTDSNGWTQLGDGWYKVDIIDTASRCNINTAGVADLDKLPIIQTDPNIAPAIVDWRDADDNPTTDQQTGGVGAESDYYNSLTPPYYAKNAPFDTVDELLLVRGITPEMLYGVQGQLPTQSVGTGASNPNPITGMTRAHTRQAGPRPGGGGGSGTGGGGGGGGPQPGGGGAGGGTGSANAGPAVDTSASTMPLCELLTTYSKELNVASDGTARVNIKTASAQDMETQLGISAQVAQSIVNGRGTNGANLTSIADLFNPLLFRGITRQVMQQIGDKITVSDAQYRNGVVNINTAPAEVLATIPGVDQNIYNVIIQARQSGTVFTGLNDLFQLTQLQASQLKTLVDHVCTKSSVYLIRVRVRMNGSSRVYAAQALVELAPPQQQTDTTGAGGAGGTTPQTTPVSQLGNDASQQPQPTILQFREVPKSPGWSSWMPAPDYYGTNGATIPASSNSIGGMVGSP